jgi:hypothetical protein
VTSGEQGLLHTTTQFADYVLKVDFLAAPHTNSGIFLRTSSRPSDPAHDCYELNIAGKDNPYPTGSLVARAKARNAAAREAWQTFEVTVQGGQIHVKLDGTRVLDYMDEHPLGRGYIGLQLNSGRAAFRNIKLRLLGLAPIFNGRDLAGWKTDQAQKSKFAVTPDGALRVTNGKGQLESDGLYADFVLQLEIFCNGRELNSGIFFRSIPGDFWMGYESQIHNGFKNGDRTQPKDGGTGAIFRRQNARRVVADDFQWFSKTIIAEADHMSVWVNGIQVSDWTDDRAAHPNPRQGRRREAGTIIIQGHDPSTDISFRNIRAGEMAGR